MATGASPYELSRKDATSDVSTDISLQAPNAGNPDLMDTASTKPLSNLTPLPKYTPGTPMTPQTTLTGVGDSQQQVTPGGPGTPAGDYITALHETLLWENSVRTGGLFVLGLVLGGLATYYVYGNHRVTLITVLSYVLLLNLALNFLRSVLFAEWRKGAVWVDSGLMSFATSRATAAITGLSAVHDRWLAAADPRTTVQVALILWFVSWIGRFLGLWTFLFLSYLALFSVPVLYVHNRAQVDAFIHDAQNTVQINLSHIKLPRTAQMGIGVLVLTFCMFTFLSLTNAVIGTFVLLTYFRVLMKPAEMDHFRAVAAPYTQTVRKATRQAVGAVDGYIQSLTPPRSTRSKLHYG